MEWTSPIARVGSDWRVVRSRIRSVYVHVKLVLTPASKLQNMPVTDTGRDATSSAYFVYEPGVNCPRGSVSQETSSVHRYRRVTWDGTHPV